MRANRVNPRHISYLCIALCLLFAGGYILRQNYLLDQAYKSATPYDYIPAGECRAILETSPLLSSDSTSALPYYRRARTLVTLWQEVRTAAALPEVDTIVLSFTSSGNVALWYRATKQEQRALQSQLPRLLSNGYRPVSETSGKTTVRHYALRNGKFLHTLSAPGVMAFSLEPALFDEARETVDVLALREQFVKTLATLDPQAPARLLQQVNDLGYRSSGRWQGQNIYPYTSAPNTAPNTIPPDTLPTTPADSNGTTKSVPPPAGGNGTAG